jgi:hypothetical protein
MHFISLFGEYQENYFVYRKFLLERCLAICLHFVRGAIYSKKDDYDAYSQGCAFSKAWLKMNGNCKLLEFFKVQWP